MELKVDDKTVFAATGGKPFDPDLPAVIFVHGAGMDHTIWALQTRWTLARLQCAGDRPARARQIRRTGIESIGDMAAWMGRQWSRPANCG